jgi:hypothetical protein
MYSGALRSGGQAGRIDRVGDGAGNCGRWTVDCGRSTVAEHAGRGAGLQAASGIGVATFAENVGRCALARCIEEIRRNSLLRVWPGAVLHVPLRHPTRF